MNPRAIGPMRRWELLGVLCVLFVTSAIRWPVMYTGFALDDYAQVAMVDGRYPAERSPFDLFTFSRGIPSDTITLMDRGFYPWWSDPEVRLSMFRPLASVLTTLDVKLFAHDAFPFHLHSLAWWLAMLVSAFFLLRSLLPAPIAWLAFALFSIDQCHTICLGWLANRNALIAGLLSFIALSRYVRYRENGERRDAIACTLSYSVALLAGEYGLSALFYFVAYEWLSRGEAFRVRARNLAYVGLPAIAFSIMRYIAGAGARNSGMYVDPIRSPLRFAAALWQRLPTLVTDGYLSISSDNWSFGRPWAVTLMDLWPILNRYGRDLDARRRVYEIFAWLGVIVFLLLLAAAARRVNNNRAGNTVWLAVGSLLSMTLLVGSMPTTRLLVIPGVGIAALLATVCVDLARHVVAKVRLRNRVGALVLLLALLWVHGVVTVQQVRADSYALSFITNRLRLAALYSPANHIELADHRVVVLGAGDLTQMIYTGLIRGQYGLPTPQSIRVLSGTDAPFTLVREGPATLSLHLDPGYTMLASPLEYMFRSDHKPMHVGYRMILQGMEVEVLEVVKGRPRAIRCHFDRPIEDPQLEFWLATARGFVTFSPPMVGSKVHIPAPQPPFLFVPPRFEKRKQ